MRSKLFALVVLIGLSILVVAGLMSAFDALHVAESEGTPSPDTWADISPEGDLQPHILLFGVKGAAHTSYLRATAATTYDLGARMWRLPRGSQHRDYDGELLVRVVPDGVQESVIDEIELIQYLTDSTEATPFGGESDFATNIPVPTSLYPLQVSYPSLLTYYPREDIFITQESNLFPYSFATVHYSFDESTLRQAGLALDRLYLDLPSGMSEEIGALAREITLGLDSPYEKARAIEAYLEANYIYDRGYKLAPRGTEPNYWFLFEEKRGLCANFNSAFVVLCRAAFVPARLVSGYKITPQFEEQEVYADQGHTWAEVRLDGLGWITFDATGSPEPPAPPEPPTPLWPTVTTIDQIMGVGDVLMKGDSFTVQGTVKAEVLGVEQPVPDMEVEVYISDSKVPEDYWERDDTEPSSEIPGQLLAGRGRTSSDGTFGVECEVPVKIWAGDYYVLAHVRPTEEYDESWSDPEIKIVSETSIKITPPEKFKVNDPVEISGTLREEPSYTETQWIVETYGLRLATVRIWNLIPYGEVEIYVDGELAGTVVTDSKGGFSLQYTFPERRSYTVRASSGGTDYYLASSAEISVGPPRFLWVYWVILLAVGGALAVYLLSFRKRFSPLAFCFLVLSACALAGVSIAALKLHERVLYPWIYLALVPPVAWLAYRLARGAYSFFRRLWGKQGAPIGSTPELAPETEPPTEGAVPLEPATKRKKAREGHLAIDFPQIREGLPDVWGVGDELQIRGSLREGSGKVAAAETMEFYLDKDLLDRTTVDETGKGGLAHAIETKGEYVIGGKLRKDSGERLIMIADYREEIIGLFNSLLERLQSQGIDVRLEATPREIQQRLLSARIGIDERLLDRIVGCFEEADYSQHPIGRRHYEVMYLSQQALFGKG